MFFILKNSKIFYVLLFLGLMACNRTGEQAGGEGTSSSAAQNSSYDPNQDLFQITNLLCSSIMFDGMQNLQTSIEDQELKITGELRRGSRVEEVAMTINITDAKFMDLSENELQVFMAEQKVGTLEEAQLATEKFLCLVCDKCVQVFGKSAESLEDNRFSVMPFFVKEEAEADRLNGLLKELGQNTKKAISNCE